MNQKGVSGRDLNQVGRDFVKKIFEFNLANQNSSQITIFDQGGSEISGYLSAWENLDSNQRVNLVLSFIDGTPSYYSRYRYTPEYPCFFTILLGVFITFWLLMQVPNNRNFTENILEKIEYNAFSFIVSNYCLNIKNPDYFDNYYRQKIAGVCIKYQKYNKHSRDYDPNSDDLLLPEIIKKDFISYKESWLGRSVFWIGLPMALSTLISRSLRTPINILNSRLGKKSEERDDAKRQTVRNLFSILSESEKDLVKFRSDPWKMRTLSLDSYSTGSTALLDAHSTIKSYQIYFHNTHNYELIAAIHYLDSNQKWTTKGWYSVHANSATLMAETTNRIFYYCFRIPGETDAYISGTDYFTAINQGERDYGFVIHTIAEDASSGKWTLKTANQE